MVKSAVSTCSLQLIREKRWPYEEYYFGEKDEKDRKTGQGQNHWTGAESIEWYTGSFFRDMMHGLGDYRWRHLDPDGAFVTYEGYFYANKLHGYGTMSYPDGRVFSGLYYKDVRWGPGIERETNLRSNVGLWRGTQLARLSWLPPTANIAPDLTTGPSGPSFLNPFRVELFKKNRVLGQTNSAIELLKKCGAEPKYASENFSKLYGDYCTDLESPICHRELFECKYYDNNIPILDFEDDANQDEDPQNPSETKEKGYFAWNNNEMTVHMMRHSYLHEKQQKKVQLKLHLVLNGPRKKIRPAAKHELDCRRMLLACYLGNIVDVAKLINDEYVYPDVCDMQGNTALMYAACGDQVDVIRLLVEAGASVDAYNDSCCTPLAVALMRFIALSQSVSASHLVPLFVPPSTKLVKKEEEPILEWMITRDSSQPNQRQTTNGGSKQNLSKLKSTKSMQSEKSIEFKKKMSEAPKLKLEGNYDSDDDVTDEKQSFNETQQKFIQVVDYLHDETFGPSLAPYYMFEFQDLMHMIDIDIPRVEITIKKLKPPIAKEVSQKLSVTGAAGAGQKQEKLLKIKDTILQLLSNGANPKLIRCPQAAIVLALKTKSTELVEAIVAHGADINEKFPEFQDYTVLDMLLTEPYSNEMLEMLLKLLELGADATHLLHYPAENEFSDTRQATLLHATIAREIDADTDYIRAEIMKILVEHNCDPRPLYDGWSVVEVAMTKNLQLLDIFIKGGTDLNMFINSINQTILTKMFSIDFYKITVGQERIQILTDLLLYGADPLIECYDGETRYRNMFEYASTLLKSVCPNRPREPRTRNNSLKSKSKSKSKLKIDSNPKPPEDDKKKEKGEWSEYWQMLDLMTECARLLHIRWLQANLVKELVDVIWTYKHRPWVMMIKEHKNRHRFTLWVSTTRCFEIWEILKSTKRKRYNNTQVLRALICIAQFYQKNKDTTPSSPYIMTGSERDIIESDVGGLLREYNIALRLAEEVQPLKNLYVKPELFSKHDYKFQVCFECALPLDYGESTFTCNICQLVHFCDMKCLSVNVNRLNCHPCSEELRYQYFPVSGE